MAVDAEGGIGGEAGEGGGGAAAGGGEGGDGGGEFGFEGGGFDGPDAAEAPGGGDHFLDRASSTASAGWKRWRNSSWRRSKWVGDSVERRTERAWRPWRVALREEMARVSGVRGPWERTPLAREALILRIDDMIPRVGMGVAGSWGMLLWGRGKKGGMGREGDEEGRGETHCGGVSL